MRVPNDKRLEDWIRELIKANKLYKFYKTRDWLNLKQAVMEDHHFECKRCNEVGRLRIATTVHHEFEVRKYPRMALTRYVYDSDGDKREVLHPLCNQCHNDVHGRTLKGNTRRKPPITVERW